jgi:hypothetical protein
MPFEYTEAESGEQTKVGITATFTAFSWSYRPGALTFVGMLTELRVTEGTEVIERLGTLWGDHDTYPVTIVWHEESQHTSVAVEYGLRPRSHDALLNRVFA